jgi:hypothetical protein
VGSPVFDNDYKHPVVLAKEVATMDVLTGGSSRVRPRRRMVQRRLPAIGHPARPRGGPNRAHAGGDRRFEGALRR